MQRNNVGYLQCFLTNAEGKGRWSKLHRLVAIEHVPNPHNKPEVNHNDQDKTNCAASNLSWMTHKENIRHSFETGERIIRKGSQSKNAKLHETDIPVIRERLAQGEAIASIAKSYEVIYQLIYYIAKARRGNTLNRRTKQ